MIFYNIGNLMISNLKKLSYNGSIILGIIFYTSTILVHMLIINQIIPLEWINGGHSSSLHNQIPLSMFNLIISLFGLCFLYYAYTHRRNKLTVLISRVLSCLWLFGLIQQLLGTPFEVFVISILLLIGLISHIRIGIE